MSEATDFIRTTYTTADVITVQQVSPSQYQAHFYLTDLQMWAIIEFDLIAGKVLNEIILLNSIRQSIANKLEVVPS